MTSLLDAARRKIAGAGMTIVLPEGGDVRIVAAARLLADQRLARPVLVGAHDEVAAAAAEAGVAVAGLEIVDAKAAADDRLGAAVMRLRPGMTALMARKLVTKPLYCGGALVAVGDADAMVAGVANPTKRVIEAALMTIGLADGIVTPSSFFLMTCPHAVGGARTVVFADCAVNADPDALALADIAIASAESARLMLGVEPRVALLSFSTRGSAQHVRVDKVTAALARVRELRRDLMIDGELQADAALSPLVARKKVPGDRAVDGQSSGHVAWHVAGQANVLVFPDLDAGNIAYKLTQYLGGATATGPFLQGFAKSVSDLSRGASVDDVVATVVLTLARAARAAFATD
jgi:phosphate acetyltransferase